MAVILPLMLIIQTENRILLSVVSMLDFKSFYLTLLYTTLYGLIFLMELFAVGVQFHASSKFVSTS